MGRYKRSFFCPSCEQPLDIDGVMKSSLTEGAKTVIIKCPTPAVNQIGKPAGTCGYLNFVTMADFTELCQLTAQGRQIELEIAAETARKRALREESQQ